MYTSDIENRHRSLLEHRRRQITDIDVVKKQDSQTPLLVAVAICGGHKMTAASDHPWSPIY